MKLSNRICGLMTSGTLAGLIYLGYFSNTMKALDIIFLAVTGALMMGALGYWLGSILENPQGNSPKGTHKPAQALASGGSNDLLTDSGSEPSDSEEMGISIELPETYTSSHFSEDTNKLPT